MLAHFVSDLQILHDKLSGGAYAQGLSAWDGFIHPTEHSQHKASGLAAAVMCLQ